MHVKIQDVGIRVEISGRGEPALVFLHYWGGTHRTWDAVVRDLQSNFQIIAYDMRGWGLSGPSDDYSIKALADEAAALIEHLDLETYALVGPSMGGKVAQLVASSRPQGLAGLILVAPATPTPSHMSEEAKHQQLHAYDDRSTVLQTIEFLCASTPSPELVEQIVVDSLSGSTEAKSAWPTQGMFEDISVDVTQIEVPTLVLAGELDRLDSIEQHREEVVARIPGSVLRIIPQSGHLLPIDQPLHTAEAIRQFIYTNVRLGR